MVKLCFNKYSAINIDWVGTLGGTNRGIRSSFIKNDIIIVFGSGMSRREKFKRYFYSFSWSDHIIFSRVNYERK